jgi:hypothetical protein
MAHDLAEPHDICVRRDFNPPRGQGCERVSFVWTKSRMRAESFDERLHAWAVDAVWKRSFLRPDNRLHHNSLHLGSPEETPQHKLSSVLKSDHHDDRNYRTYIRDGGR